VEAILGAAADLLASRGYDAASTNGIAARAGVSVGSLYQYFPNKDAIVTALLERHMRGVEEIVEAALGDLRRTEVTVREAFGRMLRRFEAFHDADPKMALAAAPQGGRRGLVEVARRREEHYREELAAVLAARPDVRRGNGALIASLLFDIVDAVTRSLMHGAAGRFGRDEARAEALEAICRFIDRT